MAHRRRAPLGLPVAAGASHSSGINVAMCSSCSVVDRSIEPGKVATSGSARNRTRTGDPSRSSPPAGRRTPGGSCEAPHGLLEAERLRDVVADRREARPHPRTVAGSHRPPRRRFTVATQRSSVSSVKKVWRITVEGAPSEGECCRRRRDPAGCPRRSPDRAQDRPRPGGPVVTDDRLALPEPSHQPREVLHLRGRDAGHAEGVLHHRDAPSDPEREAPSRQEVHGGRVGGGHHRVAGVVVRRPGDDPQVLRHRPGRPAQGARLLDVEPLGDERGAEAERLRLTHLVDQLAGRLRGAGERVEAELGMQAWDGLLRRRAGRSGRSGSSAKNARTSSVNSWGASMAAKWPLAGRRPADDVVRRLRPRPGRVADLARELRHARRHLDAGRGHRGAAGLAHLPVDPQTTRPWRSPSRR